MNYPPTKTKPWQHQRDFWNFAKNKIAAYAAFGMGAGKSKTAIDFANGINAKSILIICPKKVIDVWPYQFKLHSHHSYNILPLTKGSTETKTQRTKDFIKSCNRINQNYVIIINYESFWRPPLGPVYRKNIFKHSGLLSSIQWDLIIADEVHHIKSPGGKASWGAVRIAKSSTRRLGLSGTPFPHSPVDLYAQFRALDNTIFGTRLAKFKDDYCVIGGFEGRQVIGYKNLEDLNKKFYSIAQHVAVDDVIDLPDKQDITIKCELSPKARKIYNELDSDFISKVDTGEITASNALTKLLRLAQITGGTLVLDDKKKQYIDDGKLSTVVEMLEDLPDTEPVIIFCRFRDELKRLTEMIAKKFKARRITGEISGRGIPAPPDFTDGIWQATETNVLLVQIQSGGEGIDLTAARYCFYVSIGYSLGQYLQSKARLWRPGQSKKVFYYHIVAKGTVDQKIMRALKSKKSVVDSIIEGICGISRPKAIRDKAIADALHHA